MKIIVKEYCREAATHGVCVLRTMDFYGHKLQFFLNLFEEARKDFPDLTPEEVKVVRYDGGKFDRAYGIEFDVKGGCRVPESYTEVLWVDQRL